MGKDKGLEEAGERKEIGGHLIEVEFMSGGASYPLEDADHCWHGGRGGGTVWELSQVQNPSGLHSRFHHVKPALRSCVGCFAPWHESRRTVGPC